VTKKGKQSKRHLKYRTEIPLFWQMPTRTSRCSAVTSLQVSTIAPGTVLLNTREIIHYTGTDYFYDSSSLHICPLIPLIPFLVLPFITLMTIIFLITFLLLLLLLLHTHPKTSPFIPSSQSSLFTTSIYSPFRFSSSLSPSIIVSSSLFILRIMFNL
jgi:hypothetical protein